MSSRPKPTPFFALVGPGVLLAATGVGGGDLATATFVGGMLGTAVLWAVVVGAFMKFVVTEGLARWQLATGETILEGAAHRLGRIVIWFSLPYFLLWSFFVGSAQMSANGVALHATVAVLRGRARRARSFSACCRASSALAIVLLRRLSRVRSRDERLHRRDVRHRRRSRPCSLWPGTGAVLRGPVRAAHSATPTGEAIVWTVALIGGIGGTLTVLCYGYWLREDGRTSPEDLRTCRIDLAASYFMTALFGIAMVIVGTDRARRRRGHDAARAAVGSARRGARPGRQVAVPRRHVRHGVQQHARRLAGGAVSVRGLLAARFVTWRRAGRDRPEARRRTAGSSSCSRSCR